MMQQPSYSLLFSDGSEIHYLSGYDSLVRYAREKIQMMYGIEDDFNAGFNGDFDDGFNDDFDNAFDDAFDDGLDDNPDGNGVAAGAGGGRKDSDAPEREKRLREYEVNTAKAYTARKAKKRKMRIAGISLSLIAVFMVAFCLYTQVRGENPYKYFRENIASYEEAVQLFQSGKISLHGRQSGGVPLSAGYFRLSRGGRVRFEADGAEVHLLFYQKLGLRGNYAGFVYGSKSPKAMKSLVNRDIKLIVDMKESKWYYIVTD